MFRSRSRLRRPATLALAAALLLAAAAAGLLPSPRAGAVPRKVTHLEPDALDILRSTRKFAGSTRRHVVVRPDRLELLRGPALVASLPFPGRGGASLADVAAALAGTPQAGWAQETAPGSSCSGSRWSRRQAPCSRWPPRPSARSGCSTTPRSTSAPWARPPASPA